MAGSLPGVKLLLACVAASFLLAWTAGAALGQSRQCQGLRQRIERLQHSGPGNAGHLRQMAARQQDQISRTSAYAHGIGCSNRKFLFFGQDPPPQCRLINANIDRMRANLSNMMEQLGAGGGDNRTEIDALRGQYAAICLGQPARTPTQTGPGGLLNALFGSHRDPYNQPPGDGMDLNNGQGTISIEPLDNRRAPGDATDNPDNAAPLGRRLGGGGLAICVRECDGGFFPVSYSSWHHSADDLQRLCTARCPNAKVDLYSMAVGGDIGAARSADGQSYRDSPNAFLFRKTHVKDCGCKPKGESWAQALAKSDADSLLGEAQAGDITVNQQRSDQMAQPVAPHQTAPPRQSKVLPGKRRPNHVTKMQPRMLTPLRDDNAITTTRLPQPN